MVDDQDVQKAEEALARAKRDIQEAEEALHGKTQSPAQQPVPQAPPQAPPAPQPPPQPPAQPAPAQPAVPPSGKKWRVEFDRSNCIGAGACVAANAEFWSIDQDGKATLAQSQFDQAKNVWVLELEDEHQLQKQRDAAGVCPVTVIHIFDPDGNQEI